MQSASRLIVAMVVTVVLAAGFWILILSPKREEAHELGTEITTLKSTLANDQQVLAEATAARREFPDAYRQLVVLGKGVPGNSETPSLLVELKTIARRAGVRFQGITLEAAGGAEGSEPAAAGSEPAPTAGPAPVAATEAAAATLPLGASLGPAGVAVMPYTLKFTGNFFHIADFIHGLDNLVKTTKSNIAVDGRLITINSFSLGSAPGKTFPHLQATFSVTTYLAPPGQAAVAGVAPEAAPLTTATPASSTTGETP